MIKVEHNTFFSSLLSQREIWTIDEIINLSEKVLIPFQGLDMSKLEASHEVSMLWDISNTLPYKIKCYASIAKELFKNDGMACPELDINVFNSDCGLDSLSLLQNLINNGYDLTNIKVVRLFSKNEDSLRRSLLLHKYIFPTVNVIPYLKNIDKIDDECMCSSLLTINIFPHTYLLQEKISITIGKLLIRSRQLYSHSIFLESVDCNKSTAISSLECDYFWQDLEQTRFIKHSPKCNTLRFSNSVVLNHTTKFCVFSNTSLLDLEKNHSYKIVLENLCPGTPSRKMFNDPRRMLFFDCPLENCSTLDGSVDNEIVVTSNPYHDFGKYYGQKDYTLLEAVKQFPQYQIATALQQGEEWAKQLFDLYLDIASKDNTQCYNNIAVLLLLSDNNNNESIESKYSSCKQNIVTYLQMAIEGGDCDAMINLASFYLENGQPIEAYRYYELAYTHGDPRGAYSLGVANQFGLCSSAIDKAKAIEYYRRFFDLSEKKYTGEALPKSTINNNCKNLILLMYSEGYSMCDIAKEYFKVKNPSEDLIYAYTVISNNKTNKGSNFFDVLKLTEESSDNEASYVTFNRLCALHNGVKNGTNNLQANPESALEQLIALSKTGCPDWPEWECYIWATLATWISQTKETTSQTLATTYWLKADRANPIRSCAYKTNIALFGNIPTEEKKQIWKKFAYGNGCQKCHECQNYDTSSRCCPKAQYHWATDYEEDSLVSDYLVKQAADQEYTPAMAKIAITKVYESIDSSLKLSRLDNLCFSMFGIVPEVLLPYLNNFAAPTNYQILCSTAHQGSKKAIGLLCRILEREPGYEYYYWTSLNQQVQETFSMLQQLAGRNLSDEYFEPSLLIEKDLIKYAQEVASQCTSTDEFRFNLLRDLAEYYSQGEKYECAIELYNLAQEKGFDVSERIEQITTVIEEKKAHESSEARYYDRYDYADYDDYDYGRDTWDALTDGMYGDYPGDGVDYDFLGF